jgi:hypothetical protein
MSASFQPLVRNDGWRCCYPGRDAGYLPDRSERARLMHSAPWYLTMKLLTDLGGRQPAHRFPTLRPSWLRRPRARFTVPGDVVNEERNRSRVRGHGMIRETLVHHLA